MKELQKYKLLIVDDDEEMCEELKDILEQEGYRVDTANDGAVGIRLITKNRYNILLLDLKLPNKEGYEILKYIWDSHINLKVIVVTGSPVAEMFSQAQERVAGASFRQDDTDHLNILKLADDVIGKPFDMKTIILRVNELTGKN